jgi:hypothetical protein
MEESIVALPDDEPAQDNFDQEESNPIETEDDMLNRPDVLEIETISLELSSRSRDSAPQSRMLDPQETDSGLDDVFRASSKESTHSSNAAERLKDILSDKDGSLDNVLSILKTIPRNLLKEALKHEDQQPQQTEGAAPNDQTGNPKTQLRCEKCYKPFSRACELR